VNALSPGERELVALGAALGSNCIPCLEYHIPAARRAGLTDAQIAEALQLADALRQVPARKGLATATRLVSEGPARQPEDIGDASGQPAEARCPGGACCA
jgi:AhpD family alkylhydroperoxidase